MGTNYYVDLNTCPICKRPEETVHIGKSSAGWRFLFQLNEKYYTDIKSLKDWLEGKTIEDEYGTAVAFVDFWQMVEQKQSEYDDLNNRFRINKDGYDFYTSEFS